MLVVLRQDDDPTMKICGTEEKREKVRQYTQGRKEARARATNEDMEGVRRDPDLNSQELVDLCNNALSFEGRQALTRGIDGFQATVVRLSAMFRVAVCQKDHKVGKRSRHKKAGGTCCWGEMFGASIGDKIVRKVDGTKYAQVLL